MAKNNVADLLSVGSLFTTQAERDEAQRETVRDIPLEEISDFPNHPFKVRMDASMMEMVDSVKQYGVLVPALVRPKPDGGYEMIAGHRRRMASELAEKQTISCIVRDMTDDEATIVMVDSNLQREQILPSEYLFIMIGLYSGLRREEILGLQWDCVFLDTRTPYIAVRRAWRTEHNRPVVSTVLKTPAAQRDIPIPKCLVDCLLETKKSSISDYVIADSKGEPLAYSQFQRLWKYVTVRSTKERTCYKVINGQRIKYTKKPALGTHQKNNPSIVYTMDFEVTPHQLRHTYITNLLYAGVDPKTVQYLAGHENSKTTMDIYAKVKYNRPEELIGVVNRALT